MNNPILFKTDPHGEQALRHTEGKRMRQGQPITHQLFDLRSTARNCPLQEITMTGEELDSLCAEWMKWKRTHE